ncbi:type VI secretion system tip protein VgrG [Klebsiella aerogenes]|nr:type VI secretion system tip protein VgrG [Klebsiella aerogenes]
MSLMDALIGERTIALNRYQLDIPSCPSPLDVESFSGTEMLSQLYHYSISFTSADKDIDVAHMLSKPASLTMGGGILRSLAQSRRVHGVITAFSRISSSADQAAYQITLEPYLSLLDKQFRSHRFFVNQSVPEVVVQILQEHNLHGWEYEFNLKHNYPKREQINQYQESDLAFIQRLLAEVGIFYYFTLQQEAQSEVVHFADAQRALIFGKTLPVNSPSGMSDSGEESIWGLSSTHNVVEASVITRDYNHRDAQSILQSAPADMTRGDGEGNTYGEVYHYQPRHLARGDKIEPQVETANFYARLDHERFLASQTLVTGVSTAPWLAPAQVLTLIDNLPPALPALLQDPLLITGVALSASRKDALQVSLQAVPYRETICWRPPLLPRPLVTGTMTARVTSAKTGDIYAWQDACGLYRVKFDADRDGKSPGRESMLVRLAKPYGGDEYGFHFPLIQGTEVAIAFHEGDPDRPYIAHALHDSRHVDLVTEKNSTRNVIRTPTNNKLRMEDKRGEEHIKLSTEYGGKKQLNLGHQVNAERALRGEGFELRTDSWGAIRAGKGLFISADLQPKAGGLQLDMQAAKDALQAALQDVEGIRAAAEKAKAELTDIEKQKQLLTETLAELKQQALLLSAPAGIAQVTPATMQLSSGDNLIVTSGSNADISIGKKFRLGVKETISLFAQLMGIKIYAGKGKVDIQAQNDALDLLAQKTLTIASKDEQVIISAATELLLNCGGAYIRLKNGDVEIGAPGSLRLKCTNLQKMAAASLHSSIDLPAPCASAMDTAGGTQSPTVTFN